MHPYLWPSIILGNICPSLPALPKVRDKWVHLQLLFLLAQHPPSRGTAPKPLKPENNCKPIIKELLHQTLSIWERLMPYHQNSKISSVIALASQELVSSFCTACGAPVVDSIVPKDTGMIPQLKFGCVVLWNGVTRRKMG